MFYVVHSCKLWGQSSHRLVWSELVLGLGSWGRADCARVVFPSSGLAFGFLEVLGSMDFIVRIDLHFYL